MSAASSSSKLNKNSEVKMDAKLTHSIQKEIPLKKESEKKVKEIENRAKMDDKQLENKGISKQKKRLKMNMKAYQNSKIKELKII